MVHVAGEVAADGFVKVLTRDEKTNIEHLTEEDDARMLEKLSNLFVARYDYVRDELATSTDSSTSATTTVLNRLGLIAEEAPEEIRSADGRGIDLYKFISFLASAMKALAAQVEEIGGKLALMAEKITTKELVAQNIHAKKLCLEDVCITRNELVALLASVNMDPATDSPIVQVEQVEQETLPEVSPEVKPREVDTMEQAPRSEERR